MAVDDLASASRKWTFTEEEERVISSGLTSPHLLASIECPVRLGNPYQHENPLSTIFHHFSDIVMLDI